MLCQLFFLKNAVHIRNKTKIDGWMWKTIQCILWSMEIEIAMGVDPDSGVRFCRFHPFVPGDCPFYDNNRPGRSHNMHKNY